LEAAIPPEAVLLALFLFFCFFFAIRRSFGSLNAASTHAGAERTGSTPSTGRTEHAVLVAEAVAEVGDPKQVLHRAGRIDEGHVTVAIPGDGVHTDEKADSLTVAEGDLRQVDDCLPRIGSREVVEQGGQLARAGQVDLTVQLKQE
jgi:hypothetical protein